MKEISDALKDHLTGEVTTMASCWQIIRVDGTAFYFTDFDQDLVLDDITYSSSVGYSRTAMTQVSDLSVGNLELTGVFDDESITEADLRAGLFDYADIYLFLVNWSDLTQGILRMKRGKLGECSASPSGLFVVELRGMTQQLAAEVGDIYTIDCRADLGDSKCKVPIYPPIVGRNEGHYVGDYVRVVLDSTKTDSRQYEDRIFLCTQQGNTASTAPTFDPAPGNSTTDGTVVWQALQSWTRSGALAAQPSEDGVTYQIALDTTEVREVESWWAYGCITFETGVNGGRTYEIKASTLVGGDIISTHLQLDFVGNAGDRFTIYPGCDKSRGTCLHTFNNVVNFRGFPDVPGQDFVSAYTTAP